MRQVADGLHHTLENNVSDFVEQQGQYNGRRKTEQ